MIKKRGQFPLSVVKLRLWYRIKLRDEITNKIENNEGDNCGR
jgi:hypothetical protein